MSSLYQYWPGRPYPVLAGQLAKHAPESEARTCSMRRLGGLLRSLPGFTKRAWSRQCRWAFRSKAAACAAAKPPAFSVILPPKPAQEPSWEELLATARLSRRQMAGRREWDGGGRGRGRGRIAPGQRPVTEQQRISISEQLGIFQRSDAPGACCGGDACMQSVRCARRNICLSYTSRICWRQARWCWTRQVCTLGVRLQVCSCCTPLHGK